MAKRYSRKIVRKKTYKLTPQEAENIIKEELTTKYGNKIQKRYIFKPQYPNEPTIDFKVKANRSEAE